MGLDSPSVIFLSGAKSHGVDFTKTVTIGRQSFWPDPSALQRVFAAQGIALGATDFVKDNPFGERFYTLLGAKEIVSIDYSSYEQATLIHDLNRPIPDDWRESATAVHDGGVLEHVFHVTQAFKNCMELVRVGGHFIQVNAANNYLGHGFWQFSPELLFRIFAPANGFEIETVLMHEVTPNGAWYRVTDPDKMRTRVELCNSRPTYILTIAKRIARTEIFATPPLQSDYAPMWAGSAHGQPSPESPLKRLLPASLKKVLKPLFNQWSLFGQGWSQSCYQRIGTDAVLHGQFS